jgi:hypothetical protein
MLVLKTLTNHSGHQTYYEKEVLNVKRLQKHR